MASDSEPGKFFRGPLWEGPNLLRLGGPSGESIKGVQASSN